MPNPPESVSEKLAGGLAVTGRRGYIYVDRMRGAVP